MILLFYVLTVILQPHTSLFVELAFDQGLCVGGFLSNSGGGEG